MHVETKTLYCCLAGVNILYHDKDILAICKLAGLSTESGHAAHPSAETAAMDWLRSTLPAASRPYLRAAHRLDRPTSGVLLFAKNKQSGTVLMRQFEQRETQKIYWAVVEGVDLPSAGTLEHWIGRTPDRKMAVAADAPFEGGQVARLHYRTLETQGGRARLEITLETGRFHQIRAQLAHVGFPVVGDTRYGGPPWLPEQIMLHAHSLRFAHPRSGGAMLLTCEPEGW